MSVPSPVVRVCLCNSVEVVWSDEWISRSLEVHRWSPLLAVVTELRALSPLSLRIVEVDASLRRCEGVYELERTADVDEEVVEETKLCARILRCTVDQSSPSGL
jgi:hypothetical protein